MVEQLEQLRPKVKQAERAFNSAVLKYLLDTHEGANDVDGAVAEVRAAATEYRSVLEELRKCLSAVRPYELFNDRHVVAQAIEKIKGRHLVLETILLQTRPR